MIHFPIEDEFINCLETSSVWNTITIKENKKWKKDVIHFFEEDYFEQSMSKGKVSRAVVTMVEILMENYDPRYIRLTRTEAEKSLEKAILKCSEQSDPISRPSTSNDPNVQRLPYFGWEQNQLREILDLILVRWRNLPNQMFSTAYRIATAQRFVERVLYLIDSFYRTYGEDFDLDQELMMMFSCRSTFFFDFDDELDPYIDHLYSLDHKKPYTQGDIRKYLKRIAVEGSNPLLEGSYVDRLLRTHVIDPQSNGSEHDYYSQYSEGIEAVNYVFETKKIFFSRIILAILELLRSHVLTYGDHRVQDDSIVSNITEEAIKILSDDDFYAQYLLDKKLEVILRNPKENAFVKLLQQNLRVREFPLIMLIWKDIKNKMKIVTTTTTTSTTTSTTTTTTESTFMEYEVSERGKGHFKRVGSKCYPMNQRRNSDENLCPSSPKKSKYSQRPKGTTNKNFGYFMYIGNEEEHFFLESLQDAFSSIVENEMQCSHKGLTCYINSIDLK